MRGLLLALAVVSPVTALASVPPPPVTENAAEMQLVSFAAAPVVTCAQGTARLVEGAPPSPRTWQPWRPPGAPAPVPPTLAAHTFSINAEGRVLDLKSTTPSTQWLAQEQAAAIVSWRFAPGAPASGCSVDLAPTYVPVTAASPARLFALLAAEGRNTPLPVRKALAAGGDCGEATPRRRPQMVIYPDLRPFENKTLDPAWAGVRYDIDASGAVRNVRVAAQHGEPAFADAAASAVAEARFFPGPARTGCYAAFKASPRATEAPARPDAKRFDRPDDACKVTREALNIPAAKFYPPAYAKQRVSGWAIVRFDVAPWGQVGAIEVLEAQPSAAFGDAARSLVQSARPSPPASGYRGCVIPIVYAIPSPPEDND
ncbi:energy transducer TonB [Caulobacter sp. RHG1]|uniref:energy transducer TonB n=1 Tax=Caulobacter sp. (strain RHG1) TaxID=2545762 RepID=UPI001552E4D6|nr:energy transducer TonB [Caulobacter sp. RHG1]NQE60977.1 hypothetical protein [Caulobacter sp. RHG1]